jgi:hypothetical protein
MSTAVGDVAVGLLGWEWGARAAATSERGGACGECGFESGEGERLALNGMEATRERSAGERDADPDRAAPVVEAGASISRPLMLSGPEAVRASTASSSTAGTVCSSVEPCGWWNTRLPLWLSVLRLCAAGISISRSKMALPLEWMLLGEEGRERCTGPWCLPSDPWPDAVRGLGASSGGGELESARGRVGELARLEYGDFARPGVLDTRRVPSGSRGSAAGGGGGRSTGASVSGCRWGKGWEGGPRKEV